MKMILLLAFVLAVIGASIQAAAAPVATASTDDVLITLYDDACALSGVSNLPYRVVWKEPGKVYEGCWGAQPGMILAYFDDKSVAAIPGAHFKRARQI